MRGIFEWFAVLISAVRLAPHLVILLCSAKQSCLVADLRRWNQICFKGAPNGRLIWAFCRLMLFFPEFRNLFYYRAGIKGKLFSMLCPPVSTLVIGARQIGPGLFIQHGFATIILANRIGSNCWINQQVTIGFTNENDCPTIGDNVVISAGAKVIGGVVIGDHVIVGANAVVVKNVPSNVTVVGVPAKIVKRNGNRVNEIL